MLTFKQIQKVSDVNTNALKEYYSKQTCADCHRTKSYLFYSSIDKVVYNICKECSKNHPVYAKGHKLNTQEIFILQTILN